MKAFRVMDGSESWSQWRWVYWAFERNGVLQASMDKVVINDDRSIWARQGRVLKASRKSRV